MSTPRTASARRTAGRRREGAGISVQGRESTRVRRASRRTGSGRGARSAFDQPDFAGARTLAGFFGREFHPLAFTQELEHRAANRAAVEEVLDPPLIADEAEPLV